MFNRVAAAFALAVLPGVASAQTPRAMLPAVTLDGQLGNAFHPGRSGETYYQSGSSGIARMALAIRLGSRAPFRPVVVAEYFTDFGMGDQVDICLPAPNGTCKADFPKVSGYTVGLGVRNTLGTMITVGLTGGVGRYTLDSGAATLTGFHLDAEFALRFMKHAGVVVNVRHAEMEEFRNARMWCQPITFGLRLQ